MTFKGKAKRAFFGIGLLYLAFFFGSARDELGKADVAVVLGNEVIDNRPSRRLAARLDRAFEMYRDGWVGTIVVSGGIDPLGHNEAEVMKAYLVELGVSGEVVVTDPEGWNTRLTAENMGRMSELRGWESVVAVTHYYHLPRTALALRQAGFETVYKAGASSPEWRDFYAVPRDMLGYWAYLIGLK